MYKLNETFYLDGEYSARAKFCNENHLMINEIEADEKGRRFQIVEVPKPNAKELAEARVNELKNNLSNTDYKAIKYAEGELTDEEYAETKAQRKAWRKEINRLEVGE